MVATYQTPRCHNSEYHLSGNLEYYEREKRFDSPKRLCTPTTLRHLYNPEYHNRRYLVLRIPFVFKEIRIFLKLMKSRDYKIRHSEVFCPSTILSSMS